MDQRWTHCFHPVDTMVVCVAVHLGNSHHQVKRRMKTSTGVVEVMVCIPDATYYYNKQMGGVDLSDQLIQTSRQGARPTSTGRHSFDIAVNNAYILHRESLPPSHVTTKMLLDS